MNTHSHSSQSPSDHPRSRSRRRRRGGPPSSLNASNQHRSPPGRNPSQQTSYTRRNQTVRQTNRHDVSSTYRPPAPQNNSVEQQAALEAERKKAEEEQAREKERKLKEEKEKAERERLRKENSSKRKAQRDLNLAYRGKGTGQPKERISEAELRQLDSSLKKCTGFLRKIRTSALTEESVPCLVSEASSLNLLRYISEVVAAISEVKIRGADVEHVVVLCGELYRRYEEFIGLLICSLSTVIVGGSGNGSSARDLGSRKSSMKVLVELYTLGMIPDISSITNVLKQVMRTSKDSKEWKENKDELHASLSIIASFIRAGARTLLPKSESSADAAGDTEEISWEDEVLPQAAKTTIASALVSYYENEIIPLFKEARADLEKQAVAMKRSKNARGDPDDSATTAYEASKAYYEKVISSATVLSQALSKQPPESELNLASSTSNDGTNNKPGAISAVVANPLHALRKGKVVQQDLDGSGSLGDPFDGEIERAFYTDICHPKVAACKGSGSSSGISKDASAHNQGTPSKSNAKGSTSPSRSPVADKVSEAKKKGSEKPLSLDKVLARLPTVESKESVNTFVAQFLDSVEGSKHGPKRLIKALVTVSSQKLNLLPAYSRVAACLSSSHNDISTTLSSNLEDEFKTLVARSDIDDKSLAACVRSAKYVGEYVKFGLMGSETLFDLLSICIKDFSGHRVDMACHLLETCGRYLYCAPSTHSRMTNNLDTIWRLKSVKNLEARHNALVETAFFAARPSASSKLQRRKERPPLHEYIRHLIYYRLDASNIVWTHGQFMKLPWNEELEQYVIKKFVTISRARFSAIPYAAALISRLQSYKPALVIGIIDALLESVRSGLELNDSRDSQHRIAELQLLGELHKCGVVEEKVVYYTLYQCITLGHDSPDNSRAKKQDTDSPSTETESNAESSTHSRTQNGSYTSAPDPPGDYFRIRLACVLVESCGRMLAASNRRKLEVFWIFLERYIFCKAYQAGLGDRIPLHIDHVVGDAFEQAFQRDRRVGRNTRLPVRKEPEVHSRGQSRHEWQNGRDRGFRRSENLTESLESVQEVERSPIDSSLICVPVRYILRGPSAPVAEEQTRRIENGGVRGRRDNGRQRSPSSRSPNGHIAHVRRNASSRTVDYKSTESNDSSERLADELEDDSTLIDGDESASLDGTVEDMEDVESQTNEDGSTEGPAIGSEAEDRDIDDDDDEDDDDDDDSCLDLPVQRPKTEEEDAFAKELAAFTKSAVQSAKASSSRVTKFDRMAIPMALMTKKMEQERAAAAAASVHAGSSQSDWSGDEQVPDNKRRKRSKCNSNENTVGFKVLVRKGGKSQLQDLQVPASSSLALAAKENETADAARHEETKRLVLGSTTVLNHDEDDLDEDVPLRTQQNIRDKEESIRQQRSEDERELLSTLYRNKPRR